MKMIIISLILLGSFSCGKEVCHTEKQKITRIDNCEKRVIDDCNNYCSVETENGSVYRTCDPKEDIEVTTCK